MPDEGPKLRSYTRLVNNYDAALDGETVTFIGYTGQGSYRITALIAPEGRKRRDQKAELLARLSDAIEGGQPPGTVSMDTPRPERLDAAFDGDDY